MTARRTTTPGYRVHRRPEPRAAWVVRSTRTGTDVAVFPAADDVAAYAHAANLNEAVSHPPHPTTCACRPTPGCMPAGRRAPTRGVA
jgi:hypothetical protein